MNCRDNDLAIVISAQKVMNPLTGETITVVKAGTIVKVVRLVDETIWEIEEPIAFQVDVLFMFLRYVCLAIDDSELRPIRGEGITDDQVAELYAPAAREVAHG